MIQREVVKRKAEGYRYPGCFVEKTNVTEAFIDGAEFMDTLWQEKVKWKSVKESLPEKGEQVQIKCIELFAGSTFYDHDTYNFEHEIFGIEQSVGIEVVGWRSI